MHGIHVISCVLLVRMRQQDACPQDNLLAFWSSDKYQKREHTQNIISIFIPAQKEAKGSFAYLRSRIAASLALT
jgi:hypothetical protein